MKPKLTFLLALTFLFLFSVLFTFNKYPLDNRGAKSVASLVSHLKPIREMFGCDRAIDINGQRIERYIVDRKKYAANATINRRLGGLKQAFNLARKQGLLNLDIYIPKLKRR